MCGKKTGIDELCPLSRFSTAKLLEALHVTVVFVPVHASGIKLHEEGLETRGSPHHLDTVGCGLQRVIGEIPT